MRSFVIGFLFLGMVACVSGGWAQNTPLRSRPVEMKRPPAWDAAEELVLWPSGAPGLADYAPLPDRPVWPGSFMKSTTVPSMRIWRPATPNGRALLVIPGGGYRFVSIANEGVEIAEKFAAAGYLVAVLNYRLPGEGWAHRADVPLQDAQRAIRLLRGRAPALGIQVNRITVMGFSAGGHLAASLATAHGEAVYAPIDLSDSESARPDAVALIYPVLSMEPPLSHAGSRDLLLGPNPADDLVRRRTPLLHIDDKTPPAFLVHAFDDTTVSPDNSIAWVAAARMAKRPVEAVYFQEGGHGFGLGVPGSSSVLWADQCLAWLDRLFAN